MKDPLAPLSPSPYEGQTTHRKGIRRIYPRATKNILAMDACGKETSPELIIIIITVIVVVIIIYFILLFTFYYYYYSIISRNLIGVRQQRMAVKRRR